MMSARAHERSESLGDSGIHPTAIVSPRAELAPDVQVGPFSIIAEDVRIGRGTIIGPHVQIERWTVIGEDNRIFFGSTIGNPSKDLKYRGWRSWTRIGDRNTLREYVSVSRATFEEAATVVGDDNLIMNWTNIDHDCNLGHRTILATLATLGGHVTIEDDARIGAQAAFHPFVRVGRMAMAGGCSKFVRDIPPYTVADGHPARVRALNIVGLRTSRVNPLSKLPPETIRLLKRAFHLLFRSKLPLGEATARARQEGGGNPDVEYLVAFIERSERGVGR